MLEENSSGATDLMGDAALSLACVFRLSSSYLPYVYFTQPQVLYPEGRPTLL